MLRLSEIKKDYPVAGGFVNALKGISLSFRKNEFVSILGASGCGKTTLLNIIGGLDKYTSGDLIINGVSTKEFGDKDWDTYRNHSIGFIFQSYHLIPHQTVLQNVELALTISGVSKEERRQRAIDALEKVGLKDRIHNKPNQLSGGQAQRVAIARALINDPEIVLADEPTGALDSVTSVQIMELLKEISKDRLVIMVTHNPELAEKYSTRIIRLLDGEVTGDTMPYSEEDEIAEVIENAATAEENDLPKTNKGKKKKSSMSMGMAFMLSLKNLLSKIKRTTMVAFAGSIGIIGVSMVLAISAGVHGYIDDMQNDMLSGYPLEVTETAIDMNAMMNFSDGKKIDITRLDDKIYVDSVLETLMSFNNAYSTNVITENYKKYVDAMPKEYYHALQYGYGVEMSNYIYTDFNYKNAAGQEVTKNASITAIRATYGAVLNKQPKYSDYSALISTIQTFKQLPNNYEYILSQYDILATSNGKTKDLSESELKDIFENKNSLIMVVKQDNMFTDLNFGQFGYMTQDEFLSFAYKAQGTTDEEIEANIAKYNGKWNAESGKYEDGLDGTDFSFFIGDDAKTFKWYPNDAIYSETGMGEIIVPNPSDGKDYKIAAYKYNAYSDGFADKDSVDMSVKAILRKKSNVSYGCLGSGMYYTQALMEHLLDTSENSKIADYLRNSTVLPDIISYSFNYSYPDPDDRKLIHDDIGTGVMLGSSSVDMMQVMLGNGMSTAKISVNTVGGSKIPQSFALYPVDFGAKSKVTDYLDKWNEGCDSGSFEFTDTDGNVIKLEGLSATDKIEYTDTVGLIVSMINTMINMVTIALVAFTALSLVVSTVMVGIITYVSVVERIKEIGILRAVGARKKDIKRLFNAETLIIGLAAGLVGILVTYILSFIINMIVGSLFGIYTIAALPVWQALIMVLISVGLTLISGLIPASSAAKKDPVVALRTE